MMRASRSEQSRPLWGRPAETEVTTLLGIMMPHRTRSFRLWPVKMGVARQRMEASRSMLSSSSVPDGRRGVWVSFCDARIPDVGTSDVVLEDLPAIPICSK